jgi:hypothetical protein
MTIQFISAYYKIQNFINVYIKPAIKCHKVVLNTHALYLGGPGFKSQSRD